MSVIAHKTEQSFAEFYTHYLSDHGNRHSRQLHFFGSTLSILCLAILALTGNAWWLLAAVLAFYGCAWIGHVKFEKNLPLFKQPVYSFMAAWLMYWQMLSGQISF
ncbi:Mpo1-like protein [Herminiimonas sp. NPDC097707]|uniref:Mpo1-like protein n=1 Tax=Herminiimonas sp. NPDC097707 TaxID=3364007 RepID=UPI00383ACDBA